MACIFSALALTIGFGALAVQGASGARTELSAGVAPEAPAETPEAAFAITFEPFLASRLRLDRNLGTIRYSPRLLLRLPNLSNRVAPLLLHRGDVGLISTVTRQTQVTSRVEGYYGELEYGRVALVLGAGTVARPRRAVIPMAGYSASVGLLHAITRRYSLSLSLSGSHGGPARSTDATALSTVEQLTAGVAQQYDVSRTDRASVRTSYARMDFDPGEALEVASVEAAWERAVAPATTATISGGVGGVRELDSSEFHLLPSGAASVAGPLRILPSRRTTGQASVGVQGSPDAVSGTLLPTLAVLAGVVSSLAPWTASLQLGVSASATSEPRMEDSRESRGWAAVSAARPLGAGMTLELGVRGTLWASHWNAREFVLSDQELWCYAAWSFIVPAGPGDPGWAR